MRILIQHKTAMRKFMVVESSDRDGSLTLVMRREGTNTSEAAWSTRPGEGTPTQTDFQEPRQKNTRVTVHQSGRVNYHENRRSIFIEPLTRISCIVPIYGYRVPDLAKLDLHSAEVAEEDVVFDLSELGDGPVSFSVLIGPKDFVLPGRGMKLAYEAEGYSLSILLDNTPFAVPAAYEDHFTTLTLETGPFKHQQMAEDQALIAYHQALTGSSGPFLYRPNGEGVILLVFSVPMRIAPNFNIELADPDLQVMEQDVSRDDRSDKVMLKFKVRNRRTKQIMRREVEITSIKLDARL